MLGSVARAAGSSWRLQRKESFRKLSGYQSLAKSLFSSTPASAGAYSSLQNFNVEVVDSNDGVAMVTLDMPDKPFNMFSSKLSHREKL